MKPLPDNRTYKRKIGDIGEKMACEFLVKRGFKVLDRNYLKKWGEIDIVAQKGNKVRFVEVKSVACATLNQQEASNKKQTNANLGAYRPEENVHPGKLKRLSRVIQTYIMDRRVDQDWQLDIITVRLDMRRRIARVEMLENIII